MLGASNWTLSNQGYKMKHIYVTKNQTDVLHE